MVYRVNRRWRPGSSPVVVEFIGFWSKRPGISVFNVKIVSNVVLEGFFWDILHVYVIHGWGGGVTPSPGRILRKPLHGFKCMEWMVGYCGSLLFFSTRWPPKHSPWAGFLAVLRSKILSPLTEQYRFSCGTCYCHSCTVALSISLLRNTAHGISAGVITS